MNEVQANNLLEEILPIPSKKIMTERFSETAQESAGCNGKCQNDGVCMA